MHSFKFIRLPFLEKIFKGFYHIWAWWLSWSCELNHLYKIWSPFPMMLHIKFAIDWPSDFREEDLWKWWMDRCCVEGYTIGSPCAKKMLSFFNNFPSQYSCKNPLAIFWFLFNNFFSHGEIIMLWISHELFVPRVCILIIVSIFNLNIWFQYPLQQYLRIHTYVLVKSALNFKTQFTLHWFGKNCLNTMNDILPFSLN